MRVNQLQGFVVCCPLLHLVNAGKQHPQCQFFRFFPQLLSSPALLGLIPSGSSSSLVVSQVLNASQPRPVDVGALKSRVPHKQGAPCTRSSCHKPVAMRCTRVKCLSHCIEEGGFTSTQPALVTLLPRHLHPPWLVLPLSPRVNGVLQPLTKNLCSHKSTVTGLDIGTVSRRSKSHLLCEG